MRNAGILIVIAALPVFAQMAKPNTETAKPVIPAAVSLDTPRFSFDAVRALEKDFDHRLEVASGDHMRVVGPPRGVYLPGFGLVFTAEMDLAMTPFANPLFPREITATEKADIHKRKLEQLPLVQQLMRDMVVSAAQKMDMMPQSERVVIAVRFWYQGWEDQTRLPIQSLMSADRKSAMSGLIKEESTK